MYDRTSNKDKYTKRSQGPFPILFGMKIVSNSDACLRSESTISDHQDIHLDYLHFLFCFCSFSILSQIGGIAPSLCRKFTHPMNF